MAEGKWQTVDISKIEEGGFLNFLYTSAAGRILLKVAVLTVWSKLVGYFMDSGLSKSLIKKFIEKNGIDMHDYGRVGTYGTFNEFFTRRVRKSARPVDQDHKALIAPCDGKLTAYKLDEGTILRIKGSFYSLADVLKNDGLASMYRGGCALIFRLTVDDCHRYCYIDWGKKGDNHHIKGILHTVRPIAFRHDNVYKRNAREYTVMDTLNFGQVTQMEVGAMMVGQIKNHQRICEIKRGREKGMFLYGGSTIILLLEEGKVVIDDEIMTNTENGFETIVKMGEKIGEARP